jgi:hypothetical protein
VQIAQRAFLDFYSQKMSADVTFGDRTVFIDVTGFNHSEIATRRPALGRRGARVVDHARSDRGSNWDFVGGINRVRGLIAPYVYEGVLPRAAPVPCAGV